MIQKKATIQFNREIAKDTYLIGFKSAEIANAAKPGQFVMIQVRSGNEPFLRRPFSICKIKDNLVLILYKVVGKGTSIMATAEKGDELSILGPLGNGFEQPEKGRTSVLIAGGMGIAPLLFLAESNRDKDIQFMAGFSTLSEIIPVEHVVNADVEISISTDDGTEGHEGFVTDLLDDCLKKNSEKKDLITLYTCGPVPMLKAVAVMSLKRGIPCFVSLEAEMACGLGVCQGCVVKASSHKTNKYYHICTDGTVFQSEDIDWQSL